MFEYMLRNMTGFVNRQSEPKDKFGNDLSLTLIEAETIATASSSDFLKDRRKSRRFFILFLCVLWIVLLVSVALNLYFIFSPLRKANDEAEDKAGKLCLDCKHFVSSAQFLPEYFNVTISKEESHGTWKQVCCLTSEALNQLSQTILLHYLSSTSQNVTGDDRPSGHLTLNATATKGFPSRLRWNNVTESDGLGHLKHVGYHDDKLEITQSGTYFVYSFITFRLEKSQSDKFLNHYIYREQLAKQHSAVEMIFMDKQTRHEGQLEYQTSFLAGIVQLETHQRVYTAVSDVLAVYGSPLSNFIGLFRL